MFILKSGKPTIKYFPKKASTVFALNSLVQPQSGSPSSIQPATSSSTEHVGIILRAVTAADADYTSNTLVPVMLLDNVDFEVDVAVTATSSDVLKQVDLSDASTVNPSGTTHQVVTITDILAGGGKVVVRVNSDIFKTPGA